MSAGHLYLVATPIGNLGDLSPRAREVLAAADVIAAEDTRRTGKLLAHAGIEAKTVSLFEGNEARRTAELLEVLRSGSVVAVVSDAGMPGLSDPGSRLVRACAREGIEVRVVPGPSAAVSALVLSGLPTERSVFEGFLPRKAGERRARLAEVSALPHTIVFFESPKRVTALLAEVEEILGDRPAAVARELTKVHEEVLRGRASELRRRLEGIELRGEIVVVVEGASAFAPDLPTLVAEARDLVAEGMRKRAAAIEVARRRGGSANEIYRSLVDPADQPDEDSS